MGKKIKLWVLLLILWFGLVFTIVFSWSLRSELIGLKRAGILGRIAEKTARFPNTVRDLYKYAKNRGDLPLILKNRWPEINEFSKSGKINQNVYNDKGYLLLSAYSAQKQQSTVKLIRISDQYVIHEWVPNIEMIEQIHKEADYSKVSPSFVRLFKDLKKRRFRIIHPLLLNDGSLIFNNMWSSFLIKISKCSDVNWVTNYQHSHSIEQDNKGNIWTIIRIFPTVYDTIIEKYKDDAIALVNKHGEVIYKKSVTEILIENGYRGLLWGAGTIESDPIHLNDIQPALFKSKFWEVGDIFISIRNRSTIFLYRPQTNKILWLKTGPWLNQHDVDILSDSQISVFDNNIVRSPFYSSFGNNNVYIVDFEKDTIVSPYSSILKNLDVRTILEGRSEILENGDVFIEESGYGRLLRMSTDSVKWEFTATIDSNNVGKVMWSRYLTYNQIKEVLPILENCECPSIN